MDRQVEQCLRCGHDLGLGRFCVSCGHPQGAPVDDARTTAERPAVSSTPAERAPAARTTPTAPQPPPPAHELPRAARFPLFADEIAPTPAPPPTPPPNPAPHPSPHPPHRRRTAGLGRAAATVAVLALLAIGGVLVLNASGDATDPTLLEVALPPEPPAPTDPAPGGPAPTPSPGTGGVDPQDAAAVDVARLARATPPDTAGPSRDVRGNAVRYEAFNMLDAQADTAWRMPGDASGQEIVFRLDAPTTLVGVGLINGYAKVDPGYDGYRANRRITAVEWVLADGTVIPQDLTDDLGLQSVPVDGVLSDTVTLRIVSVTEPAPGADGRDYTAISDVALVGVPA